MLYQSRQGEDACRKLANRHYEREGREGCTAVSIWTATHHYIYISHLLTRPYPQACPNINILQSLHSLHAPVGTAGLRHGCGVQLRRACRMLHLDERVLSHSPQVSSRRRSDPPETEFPACCQVHALPLLQHSSR